MISAAGLFCPSAHCASLGIAVMVRPTPPGPCATSLVEAFDGLARELPEHVAVCCSGTDEESMTWAGLQAASEAVAAAVVGELSAAPTTELVALLAQRSPLWLAGTVGILRCGLPFVWMGGGELPPRKRHIEAARNAEILRTLRPGLVLLGEDVPDAVVPDWEEAASQAGGVRPHLFTLSPALLRSRPALPTLVRAHRRGPLSQAMCYMLTGGTTGSSKCVEVSHKMALHELRGYPHVAPSLSAQDRVLAHTPVLWAASALGQLDIALAFGAAICVSSAADQEAIRAHGATVLGLVPSSLEAMDPRSVPSVRCIFTWGEALSRVLAERWRSSGVLLMELLISTEYWLSFVCDGTTSPAGRSIYSAVGGVEFGVLPSGGRDGAPPLLLEMCAGSIGELCMRGPMVTQGYKSGPGADGSAFVPAADGGQPFFRTRDLVHLVPSAAGSLCIEFCGRNDQLVKVAGQFIDLGEAERSLGAALAEMSPGSGGSASTAARPEVAVLPSPPQTAVTASTPPNAPAAHVFVAVPSRGGAGGSGSDGFVADVYGAAAAKTLLTKVRAAAPRGAALHLIAGPLPRDAVTGKVDRRMLLGGLEGEHPTLPAWPALLERLRPYPKWLLASVLLGGLDVPVLLRLLRSLFFSYTPPRLSGSIFLLQVMLHMCAAPYLWLLSMQLPKGTLRRSTNLVPCGRFGVLALLYHLARRSGKVGRLQPLARTARTVLAGGIAAGAALAAARSRLVPWWVAFWFAIPEHAEAECSFWFQAEGWSWYVNQLCGAVQNLPGHCLGLGDLVLDLWLGLPARIEQLACRLRERSTPYSLPPALCDDYAAAFPKERVREGTAHSGGWGASSREACGTQAPGRGSRGNAPSAEEVSSVRHPDWEDVWEECRVDPTEDSATTAARSCSDDVPVAQNGKHDVGEPSKAQADAEADAEADAKAEVGAEAEAEAAADEDLSGPGPAGADHRPPGGHRHLSDDLQRRPRAFAEHRDGIRAMHRETAAAASQASQEVDAERRRAGSRTASRAVGLAGTVARVRQPRTAKWPLQLAAQRRDDHGARHRPQLSAAGSRHGRPCAATASRSSSSATSSS
mmetsp:Transcript_73297/g.238503  ORF Transcript_73297/g.238503 Transcript_73297/m.238503 type:complete len:1084 (+) Transcript_73297:2-3253(+)